VIADTWPHLGLQNHGIKPLRSKNVPQIPKRDLNEM